MASSSDKIMISVDVIDNTEGATPIIQMASSSDQNLISVDVIDSTEGATSSHQLSSSSDENQILVNILGNTEEASSLYQMASSSDENLIFVQNYDPSKERKLLDAPFFAKDSISLFDEALVFSEDKSIPCSVGSAPFFKECRREKVSFFDNELSSPFNEAPAIFEDNFIPSPEGDAPFVKPTKLSLMDMLLKCTPFIQYIMRPSVKQDAPFFQYPSVQCDAPFFKCDTSVHQVDASLSQQGLDEEERERVANIMKAGFQLLLSAAAPQHLHTLLGLKVIMKFGYERIQEELKDYALATPQKEPLTYELKVEDAAGCLLDHAGFWIESCSIVAAELSTLTNKILSSNLRARGKEKYSQSRSNYAEVILFILVEGPIDDRDISNIEELRKFLIELMNNDKTLKVHATCSSVIGKEENSPYSHLAL